MSTLVLHQPVPDFSLPSTSNKTFHLKDYQGQKIILYFYPKDATPGCTLEGENFRDHYAEFLKCNTVIFGISKDSLAAHEKFKAKKSFPFELLSDSDGKICELFGVINDKNLYGRIFRGIERSTFLIDEKGLLVQEWRKVKVSGHVDEILSIVRLK